VFLCAGLRRLERGLTALLAADSDCVPLQRAYSLARQERDVGDGHVRLAECVTL